MESLSRRSRMPALRSIPWPRPLRLLIAAGKRWSRDGGAQLGAAIAFYTMFAVAPLLVVAIAIAGAVLGPEAARGHIVGQIEGLVGGDAARSIETMIESAWRDPHGLWAGLLGVITLLIGASGVFAQLRRALNTIGHVAPLPSMLGALVRARVVAFALVLGFGFLAIASLLLSALLAALGAYLTDRFGGFAPLFALIDVTVSTAVLVVAFAALLRWLPDVPPSRRGVWVGAACSALLFSIGKHLIGLYLARAGVASSYGAAGSFVVVMMWVYYSAQILLYGAAVAATVDDAARAGGAPGGFDRPAPPVEQPHPSTVAPPTSLAAVRSRLRSSAVPMGPRRHPPPAPPPVARSAVLLHFPAGSRHGRT
ncbi:MAG TPA: YihY/virulence factor BrkB family protein [Albitalea sp.]